MAILSARRFFIGIFFSSSLRQHRKSIEALRVLDEKRLPQPFGWRDLAEQLGQHAVVGHVSVVGVRPVGAPQGSIAEPLDERTRVWNGVGIRRPLA
jgi:hypothetical protein